MSSLLKYIWKKRPKKSKINRSKYLEHCPQKKGVCRKVYTTKPKKPNSAIRKIAKVVLTTKRVILIGIPGHGHKLQQHSSVLIRGGGMKDVPGIHYKAIRGKYDFPAHEFIFRRFRRSKYGLMKTTT